MIWKILVIVLLIANIWCIWGVLSLTKSVKVLLKHVVAQGQKLAILEEQIENTAPTINPLDMFSAMAMDQDAQIDNEVNEVTKDSNEVTDSNE